MHRRGRGGASRRGTYTASKNQMASQRSRVMSTGPAGGEPCLGRAKRSCRAGSQPSPFASSTTGRSAAPAVAKTARLAMKRSRAASRPRLARDSPNVPPGGPRQQPTLANCVAILEPETVRGPNDFAGLVPNPLVYPAHKATDVRVTCQLTRLKPGRAALDHGILSNVHQM